MMRRRRSWAVIGLLVAGASIALLAAGRAPARPEIQESQSANLTALVPPSFQLGHQGLIASLLWVDLSFRFASVSYDRIPDPRFLPLLRTVQRLDSNWLEPWETGAMMLLDPTIDESREAFSMFRTAITRHPDRWQLRVYAAMLGQELSEPDSAIAGILTPILDRPDTTTPGYVRELALSYRAGAIRGTPREKAVRLLALLGEDISYPTRTTLALQLVRTLSQAKGGSLGQGELARLDRIASAIVLPIVDSASVSREIEAFLETPDVRAPESGSSRSP